MEPYKIQIIQTTIVIAIYIFFNRLLKKQLDRVALKFSYHKTRVKIIKKLINALMFAIGLGFVLFIWGVNQSELLFFISSLLTILGIAFFAQWSIISNITAAMIIFFNHPAKIGDRIEVLDKDYQIEGKISDIGIFFIIIKTAEGDKVTIANNIFLQKMIKWKLNP